MNFHQSDRVKQQKDREQVQQKLLEQMMKRHLWLDHVVKSSKKKEQDSMEQQQVLQKKAILQHWELEAAWFVERW